MSNMKVIYDCEKKTTSYVPLSGAELERMALVTLFLQSIHQSLIMDSWFDRIETAFINPMPTPILN